MKPYIDEEESVVVGKPIVEAYQLDKRQQWAGVAVDRVRPCRDISRPCSPSRFLVIGESSRTDVPLTEDKTLQTLGCQRGRAAVIRGGESTLVGIEESYRMKADWAA